MFKRTTRSVSHETPFVSTPAPFVSPHSVQSEMSAPAIYPVDVPPPVRVVQVQVAPPAPNSNASQSIQITGGTSRVGIQRSDTTPPGPVFTPQTPRVSFKKSVSVESVQTSFSTGPTSRVRVSTEASNSSSAATDLISNIEFASSPADNALNTKTQDQSGTQDITSSTSHDTSTITSPNNPIDGGKVLSSAKKATTVAQSTAPNDDAKKYQTINGFNSLFNLSNRFMPRNFTGTQGDALKAVGGAIGDVKDILVTASQEDPLKNINKIKATGVAGNTINAAGNFVDGSQNVQSDELSKQIKGYIQLGEAATTTTQTVAEAPQVINNIVDEFKPVDVPVKPSTTPPIPSNEAASNYLRGKVPGSNSPERLLNAGPQKIDRPFLYTSNGPVAPPNSESALNKVLSGLGKVVKVTKHVSNGLNVAGGVNDTVNGLEKAIDGKGSEQVDGTIEAALGGTGLVAADLAIAGGLFGAPALAAGGTVLGLAAAGGVAGYYLEKQTQSLNQQLKEDGAGLRYIPPSHGLPGRYVRTDSSGRLI